jgi:hypothetical protein
MYVQFAFAMKHRVVFNDGFPKLLMNTCDATRAVTRLFVLLYFKLADQTWVEPMAIVQFSFARFQGLIPTHFLTPLSGMIAIWNVLLTKTRTFHPTCLLKKQCGYTRHQEDMEIFSLSHHAIWLNTLSERNTPCS